MSLAVTAPQWGFFGIVVTALVTLIGLLLNRQSNVVAKVESVQRQVAPTSEDLESMGEESLSQTVVRLAVMIGGMGTTVDEVGKRTERIENRQREVSAAARAAAEGVEDIRQIVISHQKLPIPNGHPKAIPPKRKRRKPQR